MFYLRPLAAVVLMSASATTFSQVTLESEPNSMEEVIVAGQFLYTDTVNALKTPTPILDVPQSLSLMSAADIRERGFNSIGEVIAYMPGVTSSQGEGHRDAVVFRGVRSTADFYIDGMRDDVQYYRPLYNLEQVEVLRGPNALLFGLTFDWIRLLILCCILSSVSKIAIVTRPGNIAFFRIRSIHFNLSEYVPPESNTSIVSFPDSESINSTSIDSDLLFQEEHKVITIIQTIKTT